MIKGADYSTLCQASAAAGAFSGVFTNVLEVIKTQIMNDALTGEKNQGKWKHAPTFAYRCHCYYCFMRNMFKKEGYRTLFRGVGYNTSMTIVRSCILFPLYEFSRLLMTKS